MKLRGMGLVVAVTLVTLTPRLSSKQPMDAEANPLPSDDSAPPVTKMNLVAIAFPSALHPIFQRIQQLFTTDGCRPSPPYYDTGRVVGDYGRLLQGGA